MGTRQGALTIDPKQNEAILRAIGVLQQAGIDVRIASMWGEPARPYVCLALVNVVSEGELIGNSDQKGD